MGVFLLGSALTGVCKGAGPSSGQADAQAAIVVHRGPDCSRCHKAAVVRTCVQGNHSHYHYHYQCIHPVCADGELGGATEGLHE